MSNPKGNEPSLVKFMSKWNSGATKTIRVPVAIAEQVLEYARELDKLAAPRSPTLTIISDKLVPPLGAEGGMERSDLTNQSEATM